MKTTQGLPAEMERLEGLINLELGDRFWALVLESRDRKSSGVISPPNCTKQMIIRILKETIRLLEEGDSKLINL